MAYDKTSVNKSVGLRICLIFGSRNSQKEQLINLLDTSVMERSQALLDAEITAQTITRAVESGDIERMSPGGYRNLERKSKRTRSWLRLPRAPAIAQQLQQMSLSRLNY